MIERISTRQVILIIIISRISAAITNMFVLHTGPANQDIWLSILLSFFYGIILASPILFLSIRFSDLTIIGYMEKIFGKIIGKVVSVLYGLHFTRTAILFFYIAIQMIRSAFMTELAPVIVIAILMVLCLYAASRGLEVLARTAEVFSPIIIVTLIIFTVLGSNNVDLSILLPIYKDSGFVSISLGAIEIALVFTDIFILAMNIPQLTKKKDIIKIVIKANLYSILIILMLVVVTQTSLGVEQAKHANYPFLTYVRMVRAYSIFERIESAFLVIWTLTITARIVAYIYISSLAFKEIFNKENTNTFVYPICIIASILTYYFADINPMIGEILRLRFSEYVYYFIFETGIPLIALIIYFFRRKTFARQERLSIK